jgi:8-oxo-dGTP pyrophosphatase MutT (NUDIX family)
VSTVGRTHADGIVTVHIVSRGQTVEGRREFFGSKIQLIPSPRSGSLPAGGSIRAEELGEAAARELSEETGPVIDPAELGDPVAACRVSGLFRGQRLSSVEVLFA